ERAHQYFERAEKVPHDEKKILLFNHAFALTKLGRNDDAIQKYLECLRADPIFAQAHFNVGLIYLVKNQNDLAISHLSEVLRWGNPNDRNANLNLGRAYGRQGDKTSARKHLGIVLKVSPGDHEALQLWKEFGL